MSPMTASRTSARFSVAMAIDSAGNSLQAQLCGRDLLSAQPEGSTSAAQASDFILTGQQTEDLELAPIVCREGESLGHCAHPAGVGARWTEDHAQVRSRRALDPSLTVNAREAQVELELVRGACERISVDLAHAHEAPARIGARAADEEPC